MTHQIDQDFEAVNACAELMAEIDFYEDRFSTEFKVPVRRLRKIGDVSNQARTDLLETWFGEAYSRQYFNLDKKRVKIEEAAKLGYYR